MTTDIASWRQQDGGQVGKEPMRFTIRWDTSMGCYRVSVPNFKGPLQVVPAEAYDRARKDADMLADSCIATARDRDHQVELYEAAMNWFSVEQWRAFEESDLFKEAEASALAEQEPGA
jgi:hypothetical protein